MKKIFLLFLILFIMGSVAFASDLLLVAPQAGGSVEAKVGTNSMWFILGQPLIGESILGSNSAQFGAIYWGDEDVTVVASSEDNGLINNTVISRLGDTLGSKIKITWGYSDKLVDKQAYVFRFKGNDRQFIPPDTAGGWDLLTAPTDKTEYIDDENEVNVGNEVNAYYRVVPSSVKTFNTVDIMDPVNNARTVAKIDIPLKQTQFDIVSFPLLPTNSSGYVTKTQDIFGAQVANAQLLYNEGGLYLTKCINKVWQDKDISVPQGFWLSSDSDISLTLVGQVVTSKFEKSIVSGFDLYGYPVPKQIDVVKGTSTSLGITPSSGDEILVNQGGLYLYKFTSQGWSSDFQLGIGKGYWYNNPLTTARSFTAP